MKTDLLTTKQLHGITGCSVNYFEKGRTYGYGPKFIRLPTAGHESGRRGGKILYRRSDVETWLQDNECQPGGFNNA